MGGGGEDRRAEAFLAEAADQPLPGIRHQVLEELLGRALVGAGEAALIRHDGGVVVAQQHVVPVKRYDTAGQGLAVGEIRAEVGEGVRPGARRLAQRGGHARLGAPVARPARFDARRGP